MRPKKPCAPRNKKKERAFLKYEDGSTTIVSTACMLFNFRSRRVFLKDPFPNIWFVYVAGTGLKLTGTRIRILDVSTKRDLAEANKTICSTTEGVEVASSIEVPNPHPRRFETFF